MSIESSGNDLIDSIVSLPLFHVKVWILRSLRQPLVVSRLRLDLTAHKWRKLCDFELAYVDDEATANAEKR
jgi:hypothetical protein